MTTVSRHGWALQDASEELRADKEVVMAAVKQDGDALKFASDELRANREVVLAAVEQNRLALKFAPPLTRKLWSEWPCVRLLFVGHAGEDSPLSRLPAELVRGPLLAALLRVI